MRARTGTKPAETGASGGTRGSTRGGSRGALESAGAGAEPLRAEALETIRDLRSALAELLAGVGTPIRQPRDLKVALGLHQTLAWKIHRIAQGDDPLADAPFIPGASGFATFLEAARARGLAAPTLARAREAYERFRGLVSAQSGDRASLELMLSGLEEKEAPADLRSVRRGGYRCNSAVWGMQLRMKLLCQIVGPSATEGLLDFVIIRGLIGMRRLRQGVVLPIAPISLVSEEGQAPESHRVRPLDRDGVHKGLALMPQFSSSPMAEINIGKNAAGIAEYQLGATPIGGREGTTVISGERIRGAGSMYRDGVNDHGRTALAFRQPIERAVLDVWVHRACMPNANPSVMHYSEVNGVHWDDQAPATAEVLPLVERVEHRGVGLSSATLMDVPQYRGLMEFSFRAAGWNPEEFALYRVRMDYPPISTALVMRLELPERP